MRFIPPPALGALIALLSKRDQAAPPRFDIGPATAYRRAIRLAFGGKDGDHRRPRPPLAPGPRALPGAPVGPGGVAAARRHGRTAGRADGRRGRRPGAQRAGP